MRKATLRRLSSAVAVLGGVNKLKAVLEGLVQLVHDELDLLVEHHADVHVLDVVEEVGYLVSVMHLLHAFVHLQQDLVQEGRYIGETTRSFVMEPDVRGSDEVEDEKELKFRHHFALYFVAQKRWHERELTDPHVLPHDVSEGYNTRRVVVALRRIPALERKHREGILARIRHTTSEFRRFQNLQDDIVQGPPICLG